MGNKMAQKRIAGCYDHEITSKKKPPEDAGGFFFEILPIAYCQLSIVSPAQLFSGCPTGTEQSCPG
jgi:hypothetical protein